MKDQQTLVILAAGRGSRFGGAKQFALFGDYQKTLMEYNICHAIDAGIGNIVFITQPCHEQQLLAQVISHLPSSVTAKIVFQDNDNLPSGCVINPQRTKPLGTAHALWCARHLLDEHFIVINADDYYGQDAFALIQQHPLPDFANMVGYVIEKTLSEHGGVNRGLCQLSETDHLISIKELSNIHLQRNGQLVGENDEGLTESIPANSLISMNFWCFNQHIFTSIEALLISTFNANNTNIIDEQECYLPDAAMKMINGRQAKIKVLTSLNQWFGVTYAADSSWVDTQISHLIDKDIFSSIKPRIESVE